MQQGIFDMVWQMHQGRKRLQPSLMTGAFDYAITPASMVGAKSHCGAYFTITFMVRPSLILTMLRPFTGASMR